MIDVISLLNENTLGRNSRNGVSSIPSSSLLSSKSAAAKDKKRMSLRFSRRLISLLLKMSSLLPGTLLTPVESYTLTASSSLKPLYLATPDDTSEDMRGPTEGMTAGCRHIEYCRDCEGTSAERVRRWKREEALEDDVLSAHLTSSSRDKLASSPP